MTNAYLFKTLVLAAVPGITYFASKKLPFIKEKPIYHSLVIFLASAIAGGVFWLLK